MDVLMECCCGLDVHRDMVEACIIKGMLETPQIIREQFITQGTVLCAESNLKVLLSQHTEILVIFEENRTISRNTENRPLC